MQGANDTNEPEIVLEASTAPVQLSTGDYLHIYAAGTPGWVANGNYTGGFIILDKDDPTVILQVRPRVPSHPLWPRGVRACACVCSCLVDPVCCNMGRACRSALRIYVPACVHVRVCGIVRPRLVLVWLGLAWLGLAWLGLAWLGLAWLGLAWFGQRSAYHVFMPTMDYEIGDGVWPVQRYRTLFVTSMVPIPGQVDTFRAWYAGAPPFPLPALGL